ncbi:hypothetical protein CYLTODRAFT_485132 [Cylindrobasidium torrendii FP15055 ss-10]|uniref:Uncharacterized protein n=1 Tax=Cylindrobasidium torrendii FP15055 ss-10 TaxID=1314674 RepID=A0A0D7BTZ1_9AGAR|nr:hypothetical protein CYLTODRAFT_485132 [Cylindrobasidium torrendii FP15055 ss-10]
MGDTRSRAQVITYLGSYFYLYGAILVGRPPYYERGYIKGDKDKGERKPSHSHSLRNIASSSYNMPVKVEHAPPSYEYEATSTSTLDFSPAVTAITIEHNVLRRQLRAISRLAPSMPAHDQEAFLKYAAFGVWHVRTYLSASASAFAPAYQEASRMDHVLLPYVADLEHELNTAPVGTSAEAAAGDVDADVWPGADIAATSDRICELLFPFLNAREGEPAEGVDLLGAVRREARDGRGRIGDGYAMAMIDAHLTKGERNALGSQSKVSSLTRGMMYSRWTKFARQ